MFPLLDWYCEFRSKITKKWRKYCTRYSVLTIIDYCAFQRVVKKYLLSAIIIIYLYISTSYDILYYIDNSIFFKKLTELCENAYHNM